MISFRYLNVHNHEFNRAWSFEQRGQTFCWCSWCWRILLHSYGNCKELYLNIIMCFGQDPWMSTVDNRRQWKSSWKSFFPSISVPVQGNPGQTGRLRALTGSQDTRPSLGTTWLTIRQPIYEKIVATHHASEYTPRQCTVLNASPKGAQRQRQSGRPTTAPKDTDIDWRVMPGARHVSQWEAWNHVQQGSTDWRAGICRL